MLLASAIGPSVRPARADTRGELRAAKQRLREIGRELAAEAARATVLQQELNALALKIERAESAIERTRAEILGTRRQIGETEADLAALQERLEQRAVEVFVRGPAGTADLLLGATSFADLTDRIAFVDALATQNADLAIDVENRVNALEIKRTNLQGLEDRQRDALEALDLERQALAARFDEQQRLVDRMRVLRNEADRLVGRLEARLKREIAFEAAYTLQGGAGDGIPGPLEACPVRGPHAYADTFGDVHVHPGWTHLHQGNDIIAPYGTPIVAPFDGVATGATDGSAGIYVTVAGAEGSAIMMHMSATGKLGPVATGDVIGYVGETGNASGPHTHFEWHPGGGAAVDPFPQLNEVC